MSDIQYLQSVEFEQFRFDNRYYENRERMEEKTTQLNAKYLHLSSVYGGNNEKFKVARDNNSSGPTTPDIIRKMFMTSEREKEEQVKERVEEWMKTNEEKCRKKKGTRDNSSSTSSADIIRKMLTATEREEEEQVKERVEEWMKTSEEKCRKKKGARAGRTHEDVVDLRRYAVHNSARLSSRADQQAARLMSNYFSYEHKTAKSTPSRASSVEGKQIRMTTQTVNPSRRDDPTARENIVKPIRWFWRASAKQERPSTERGVQPTCLTASELMDTAAVPSRQHGWYSSWLKFTAACLNALDVPRLASRSRRDAGGK